MILTQILQQNCIKVPVESKDKKAVITELVDLVDSNTAGILLDRNVVLEAVLVREEARSTGIGSGIAIPHGKSTSVKELAMALGIAKDSIEFGSIDGKPVKIIMLLLSPADQTGPHIQALAKISRLMLDDKFKQRLEKVGSAEEAYALLSDKET